MDFGELLNELAVSLNAIHRRDICGKGETLALCFMLSSIQNKGVHMSSLAYKLGVDNSTLTRLIENLERKNLAFRQRDEHDKRIINVFLTNNGEELMLKFSDRIEFLGKNIFDDIPMDKRESVKEALELLLWHLARKDVK
tara:strand:- start:2379 stop:2798 length:420 start_codon:yes stop_codon:yes gene_type:complete